MNTYFSPSRKGLFNLPVGDDAAFNAISWTFAQPEAPVA